MLSFDVDFKGWRQQSAGGRAIPWRIFVSLSCIIGFFSSCNHIPLLSNSSIMCSFLRPWNGLDTPLAMLALKQHAFFFEGQRLSEVAFHKITVLASWYTTYAAEFSSSLLTALELARWIIPSKHFNNTNGMVHHIII